MRMRHFRWTRRRSGELLEIFEEFGVSFVIEDVEDYGQYGLDDPEGTIRLEAGEESYEILLGDFSAMDSGGMCPLETATPIW